MTPIVPVKAHTIASGIESYGPFERARKRLENASSEFVNTKVCRNCKWWKSSRSADMPDGLRLNSGPNDTVEGGGCHRYAPHPYFASTREDDWCGEFTPKDSTATS